MIRAEWVIAAALSLAGGCGQWTQQRPLSFAVPDGVDPRAHFDHVVSTLRREGYRLVVVQPEQRRVGVCARYRDGRTLRQGSHRIAITCERGRYCRIFPLGPRVERTPTTVHVPTALAQEVLTLRQQLTRPPATGTAPSAERVLLQACD